MSWRQKVWRRAAVVRVFDVADAMVVMTPDGRGLELSGDTASLAREVLSFVATARTGDDVVAHVESVTGGPVEHAESIGALLRQLEEAGTLEDGHGPAKIGSRSRMGPARIVLGLTGAVATMHAPALVQALLEAGFRVRCVTTDDALRFVRPEALEALTHERVVTGMWPDADAVSVPHIELSSWADAVVVCPASATTISRLATGDHASVVSAVALATRAPVLVVPSMNASMYESASVRRNLGQLIEDGMHVAHPARGPEVADRPHERALTLGAAPPPAVVVQLLTSVLQRHAAAHPIVPRTGQDWESLYRRVPPRNLGWHRDEADDDVIEAVQRHAPPSADVLDVGTGLGSVAIACAARGYRVLATDVSESALAQARARPGAESVVWLRDDITGSNLHGQFALAIDRGCLPMLDEAGARAYAANIERLVRPGGALIVKFLTGQDAIDRHAHPYTVPELRERLGSGWALIEERASTLPGRSGAPRARLVALRRSGEP